MNRYTIHRGNNVSIVPSATFTLAGDLSGDNVGATVVSELAAGRYVGVRSADGLSNAAIIGDAAGYVGSAPIYADLVAWGADQSPPRVIDPVTGGFGDQGANVEVCFEDAAKNHKVLPQVTSQNSVIVDNGDQSFTCTFPSGVVLDLTTTQTGGNSTFNVANGSISTSSGAWQGTVAVEVTNVPQVDGFDSGVGLRITTRDIDTIGSSVTVNGPQEVFAFARLAEGPPNTFTQDQPTAAGTDGIVLASAQLPGPTIDLVGPASAEVANVQSGPFLTTLSYSDPATFTVNVHSKLALSCTTVCGDVVRGELPDGSNATAAQVASATDECIPVESIYLVGDSFYNDFNDIARRLRDIGSYDPFDFTDAIPGSSLATADDALNAADLSPFDLVVIARCANDIINNATFEQMQTRAIDAITAAGGKPVVIVNCPPFGNSPLWTEAIQAVVDQYNDWLPVYAASQQLVTVFDINSVLDTTGDNALDAEFDSGDGLHPDNATGLGLSQAAIALDALIETICL